MSLEQLLQKRNATHLLFTKPIYGINQRNVKNLSEGFCDCNCDCACSGPDVSFCACECACNCPD